MRVAFKIQWQLLQNQVLVKLRGKMIMEVGAYDIKIISITNKIDIFLLSIIEFAC